ncbi:Flp1 family type IVb pilin [Gorillibacterium sp. sgz500922]|uniref:Flp1 family type IVb pilin n=1 Tax=Gorillibacterium sp. sgz500922 TaxID=3446694 RepID=UPI003F66BDE5
MKKMLSAFWKNEEGLGTLELLLILAVLVLIAIAFRKWIVKWVNKIFDDTNTEIFKNTDNPSTPAPSGK